MKKDVCPKCLGTGYIVTMKQGRSYARRCDCLLQRMENQRFQVIGIPRSLAEAGLDNYMAAFPFQEKAKKAVTAYLERFPDCRHGLLFMGPTGVGKTHLAVAVLKEIVARTNETALFVDITSLLQQVKREMGERSPDGEARHDPIMEVAGVPYLLLDDLGAQKVSMWTQEKLRLIINHRYNNKLLTFVTTPFEDKPRNPEQQSLEYRIGDLARSRLYEMCKTIVIHGQDYRRLMINPKLK